jgi:ABC-2 type transport system ATP-binding protein
MDNVIEMSNVTKCYSDFKLNNIDINVKKGFVTGFIGPNGSGKSTTIKLLMNLLQKQSGTIKIFGMDNITCEKDIKSRIGFVYDEFCFFEHLSINSNEKIIAPFYENWDHELFKSYLHKFQLNPKKRLSKLSKGMKTKFSLAVALSHNADLLIMDEPTAGLDPIFRRELLDILYDLMQDENKSIFLSTHITSDLDKIADYITFINKGEIIFSKSTNDIFDNYKIVKGSKELLSNIDESLLIGMKTNRFGFEGLTTNAQKLTTQFNDSIIIDNANLEDIMIFYSNS